MSRFRDNNQYLCSTFRKSAKKFYNIQCTIHHSFLDYNKGLKLATDYSTIIELKQGKHTFTRSQIGLTLLFTWLGF